MVFHDSPEGCFFLEECRAVSFTGSGWLFIMLANEFTDS